MSWQEKVISRSLDEGTGDENDFIHTEQFVLVDKERRIRGYYDGTDQRRHGKVERRSLSVLKAAYAAND